MKIHQAFLFVMVLMSLQQSNATFLCRNSVAPAPVRTEDGLLSRRQFEDEKGAYHAPEASQYFQVLEEKFLDEMRSTVKKMSLTGRYPSKTAATWNQLIQIALNRDLMYRVDSTLPFFAEKSKTWRLQLLSWAVSYCTENFAAVDKIWQISTREILKTSLESEIKHLKEWGGARSVQDKVRKVYTITIYEEALKKLDSSLARTSPVAASPVLNEIASQFSHNLEVIKKQEEADRQDLKLRIAYYDSLRAASPNQERPILKEEPNRLEQLQRERELGFLRIYQTSATKAQIRFKLRDMIEQAIDAYGLISERFYLYRNLPTQHTVKYFTGTDYDVARLGDRVVGRKFVANVGFERVVHSTTSVRYPVWKLKTKLSLVSYIENQIRAKGFNALESAFLNDPQVASLIENNSFAGYRNGSSDFDSLDPMARLKSWLTDPGRELLNRFMANHEILQLLAVEIDSAVKNMEQNLAADTQWNPQ